AGEPYARDAVDAPLVHRALDPSLKASVDAGSDIAGLHVDARPRVVDRGASDGLHEPDVVVEHVHQAGNDAAILGLFARIDVAVAVGADLDGLASAHVLDADGGHDRLQALRVERVVIELRPGILSAGHEVPAIEIEDKRSVARGARQLVEIGRDADD